MTDRPSAVLTGDFVRSRDAGPERLEAGFAALRRATAEAEPWAGDLRLTRYRGDGWQCLVGDARFGLRTALLCAAHLRAETQLESRIALGLGLVTTLGSTDLSDADGPAFHRAGQALDAMKRNRRLALAPDDAPPLAPALVTLIDALTRSWTAAQAAALIPLLPPSAPSQKAVAETLGITAQSLGDRLDAAGWPYLEDALIEAEEAFR
ncbi:hypothetical protein AADZ90_013050 [Aestuariibius sp. 2305UL40-4]|uniref:hypothetical protein n=1 Tax=Aestuariibius violaceus TaxID=3234132 RepID=UPI00345E994F